MATTATDLISTTINDLEAAVYSYSAVQGDKALHAAIHEGGRNLFLVGRALEAAKTELGGRDLAGDADASSTMDLLKQCKVNAELSKIIFNAVALAPEASRAMIGKPGLNVTPRNPDPPPDPAENGATVAAA
ncbi:hypothetical protein H9Q73_012249 [Fusarium xylarioides]|nr:hypothetical protein H9Q73_012249 [Fusarium xylarioides]